MTPKFKVGDRVMVAEGAWLLEREGGEPFDADQPYAAIVTYVDVYVRGDELIAYSVLIPDLDEEFFCYEEELYPDPAIREELINSVSYDS